MQVRPLWLHPLSPLASINVQLSLEIAGLAFFFSKLTRLVIWTSCTVKKISRYSRLCFLSSLTQIVKGLHYICVNVIVTLAHLSSVFESSQIPSQLCPTSLCYGCVKVQPWYRLLSNQIPLNYHVMPPHAYSNSAKAKESFSLSPTSVLFSVFCTSRDAEAFAYRSWHGPLWNECCNYLVFVQQLPHWPVIDFFGLGYAVWEVARLSSVLSKLCRCRVACYIRKFPDTHILKQPKFMHNTPNGVFLLVCLTLLLSHETCSNVTPSLFYPGCTAHQVCNSLSIVGCVCMLHVMGAVYLQDLDKSFPL